MRLGPSASCWWVYFRLRSASPADSEPHCARTHLVAKRRCAVSGHCDEDALLLTPLATARIGQRVTAIVSSLSSLEEPAHGRARIRATHTRCSRLGWRHVRDLCLPAPGARHA